MAICTRDALMLALFLVLQIHINAILMNECWPRFIDLRQYQVGLIKFYGLCIGLN